MNPDEYVRDRVDSALKEVKKILDETRNPKFAADVDHKYEDKFCLAEFLTNTALAASTNTLERVGLDYQKLMEIVTRASGGVRSATLRFAAEESCIFIREDVVQVDSGTNRVLELTRDSSNGEGGTSTLRTKVSTTVKEYWWKVDIGYEIFVFIGSDSNEHKMLLVDRNSSCELVTTGTKTPPFPSTLRRLPLDLSLTWLIKNLSIKGSDCFCNFSINRTAKSCRTPRRNDDIKAAVEFFEELNTWCSLVENHFKHEIEMKLSGYLRGFPTEKPAVRPTLFSVSSERIFVPVLALFEGPMTDEHIAQQTEQPLLDSENQNEETPLISRSPSYALAMIPQVTSYMRPPLLPIKDIDLFLKEQRRTLAEEIRSLNNMFPSSDSDEVLSSLEALLCLLSSHLSSIALHYFNGVDSIEGMLKSQLIDAIGKYVEPKDFSKYMQFHSTKLFKYEYLPAPFCYSVRQPEHYPDGTFTICSNGETIETICRKVTRERGMMLPIDAATTVELTGDCFLHAWITHSFGSFGIKCLPPPHDTVELTVRARQFSSMLIVMGKISGPDTFEPAAALIVQNKDELIIPLLLEQLPTSKEFKDAIASLSPEQQNFAKAFRSMQLESSVFGICIIQLKPQLERLLGLPPDSLQKEIRLTQNLLELFIEYQIPSDLLTYRGDASAPTSEKLSCVKGYVSAVMAMVDEAKTKQLADEKQEADMRFEMNYQRPKMAAASHMAMSMVPPMAIMYSVAKMSALPYQEVESSSLSRTLPNTPKVLTHLQSSISEKVRSLDLSTIPIQLDLMFEKFDEDSAFHPTIIKPGDVWTRKRCKHLLAKAAVEHLKEKEQGHEKNKAFDLLDALSRSGSLPIACTEVHAIVGAAHCFDLNIMETVVQENINPVDRFERSLLIVASTIHGISNTRDLIRNNEQISRISIHSPKLVELHAPENNQTALSL